MSRRREAFDTLLSMIEARGGKLLRFCEMPRQQIISATFEQDGERFNVLVAPQMAGNVVPLRPQGHAT